METIKCPQCKYYYAPVCTFHKTLPMTSRHGFCHHAEEGKYEGPTPVIQTLHVSEKRDQTAKADAGKLQISLVPTQIIRDIAEVREYGNRKYGDSESWKRVEKCRYIDALCRHLLAYIDDPEGVDEESGIKHYKHMACNMAFLCHMEKEAEHEFPWQ